jgi:hypothetical protein
MLVKILLIFFGGIIETFLYASYILALTEKQVLLSTFLMGIYMFLYLAIISYAIKDTNTITLILIYALACAVGNYFRVNKERKDNGNH